MFLNLLKLRYCEKATQFEQIFLLDLMFTYLVMSNLRIYDFNLPIMLHIYKIVLKPQNLCLITSVAVAVV